MVYILVTTYQQSFLFGPYFDKNRTDCLLDINHTVSSQSYIHVHNLATDVSLTADPGVVSLIPARSHTFMEIDHEIISTVILLSSAESFKKGCSQLQVKVCARSTG